MRTFYDEFPEKTSEEGLVAELASHWEKPATHFPPAWFPGKGHIVRWPRVFGVIYTTGQMIEVWPLTAQSQAARDRAFARAFSKVPFRWHRVVNATHQQANLSWLNLQRLLRPPFNG